MAIKTDAGAAFVAADGARAGAGTEVGPMSAAFGAEPSLQAMDGAAGASAAAGTGIAAGARAGAAVGAEDGAAVGAVV